MRSLAFYSYSIQLRHERTLMNIIVGDLITRRGSVEDKWREGRGTYLSQTPKAGTPIGKQFIDVLRSLKVYSLSETLRAASFAAFTASFAAIAFAFSAAFAATLFAFSVSPRWYSAASNSTS